MMSCAGASVPNFKPLGTTCHAIVISRFAILRLEVTLQAAPDGHGV